MGLNRSRYFNRGPSATQECQVLADALARIADAELLEAIVNNIGTINEHGGELFIAARREKVQKGRIVDSSEPGTFETIGYAVAYNSKAQLPGTIDEPNVAYGTADSAPPPLEPELLEEPVSENGVEPEEVHA